MSQNPLSNAPYLIIGLGNPGPKYAGTRHNAGFMAVDELARRHNLHFSQKQANAEIARGNINGTTAIVAKPLTYMNLSGNAVGALLRYYKIPLDRLLVVYDDIALPLGTIRIREKGSAGGHNGLTDISRHLGTQTFPRLRIGVDRPVAAHHSQIDWVLGRFTKDEQKVISDVLPRTAEAIETILRDGLERAMNSYNLRPDSDKAGAGNAPKEVLSTQRPTKDNDSSSTEQREAAEKTLLPALPVDPAPAPHDDWKVRLRRIIERDQAKQ
ncbi:MAG: aminoacyl-tRNA hydrolase [Chloroflexi bacterium]|nr:aminoacyl-tRNA hydrolase [Chloroflexota bacterium]